MLKFFTKKRGQKGFTLIELLVVIAIIGILATIVMVALGGARVRARNAQRMSDIRAIQMAMEMYYDVNDWAHFTKATIPSGNDLDPFLYPIPVDPINRGDYVYGWTDNTADDQQFCIWARLETDPPTLFVASEKGTREMSLVGLPLPLYCW